jgi:hypothetical protein
MTRGSRRIDGVVGGRVIQRVSQLLQLLDARLRSGRFEQQVLFGCGGFPQHLPVFREPC